MTDNNTPNKIEILLDSARGIFIPRDFAELFGITWKLSAETIETLKNPDNEWYWEKWNHVLNTATCTIDGHVYALHHDGDLFAVRDDLTNEESEEFYGSF